MGRRNGLKEGIPTSAFFERVFSLPRAFVRAAFLAAITETGAPDLDVYYYNDVCDTRLNSLMYTLLHMPITRHVTLMTGHNQVYVIIFIQICLILDHYCKTGCFPNRKCFRLENVTLHFEPFSILCLIGFFITQERLSWKKWKCQKLKKNLNWKAFSAVLPPGI